MAFEHVALPFPDAVSVWVPNEVEGQILGGNERHYTVALQLYFPLVTYARRHGFTWLVRQETELRYLRADGSIGAVARRAA